MKSGLSLEFKPEKVQAVHFTNQIKYKTNANKHDDGEWCSIVYCVTLKEVQTSHMKQAAVSRLMKNWSHILFCLIIRNISQIRK